MPTFGDGLEQAVQKAFTRPIPKSAGAQMRYLVKQYKSTKQVAQMLRISQRTVERYVKDQIKKPRRDLAQRLEREVRKRWQPQIRQRAKETAATSEGIVIDFRARLGYTAPIGSTDQDRIRHLTVALPPQYAARLFTPRNRGQRSGSCRRSPPTPSRRSTSRTAAAAPAAWKKSASPTSSTSSSSCRNRPFAAGHHTKSGALSWAGSLDAG